MTTRWCLSPVISTAHAQHEYPTADNDHDACDRVGVGDLAPDQNPPGCRPRNGAVLEWRYNMRFGNSVGVRQKPTGDCGDEPSRRNEK